MKQPRTSQSQQHNYFEGFPYSSRLLSVFFYSKSSNQFILSVGRKKEIVYFKTERVKAFANWLRNQNVPDFNAYLKEMGIKTNI